MVPVAADVAAAQIRMCSDVANFGAPLAVARQADRLAF
jgi:hypothetical protein